MLVFVRGFLLESDATGCLMRLLKFPPVEDITELVSMAVRYRDYVMGGMSTAKPVIGPASRAAPEKPVEDPLADAVRPRPTDTTVASAAKPQQSTQPVSDPLNAPRPPAAKPVLIKDTRTL
jgi:hypothetical protein